MRQHVSIDLAALLLPIARQAGDAIMSIYSSGQSGFREKADHSPVTEADLAAHVVLAKALGSLSPGYPVVSEEDERSLAHRNGSGRFWLIDPLDGTKEFIARNGSSLKFCRVAEGVADIYPRLAPTYEWDTAAAQAVLEGAGGVVLDREGNPLRYGKPDVLNPSFVAARNAVLIPA